MTLHCYCCGDQYERGKFKCCAPPAGMASRFWLEKFCYVCGTETRGKCPKHCTCPKPEKVPVTIDNWQNTAKLADAVRREWTPYREQNP